MAVLPDGFVFSSCDAMPRRDCTQGKRIDPSEVRVGDKIRSTVRVGDDWSIMEGVVTQIEGRVVCQLAYIGGIGTVTLTNSAVAPEIFLLHRPQPKIEKDRRYRFQMKSGAVLEGVVSGVSEVSTTKYGVSVMTAELPDGRRHVTFLSNVIESVEEVPG